MFLEAVHQLEVQLYMKNIKLKVMAAIAACICVVGSSVAVIPASAASIRGDINGDGKIDMTDAVALNKFLSGRITVDDMTTLDMDGDYLITPADATKLLRFLTGQFD